MLAKAFPIEGFRIDFKNNDESGFRPFRLLSYACFCLPELTCMHIDARHTKHTSVKGCMHPFLSPSLRLRGQDATLFPLDS
jgi:hypothetical protein